MTVCVAKGLIYNPNTLLLCRKVTVRRDVLDDLQGIYLFHMQIRKVTVFSRMKLTARKKRQPVI